jgi:hypothetical protein
MAVRSNYIKNLMESKDSLDKQYQEVIAESMKNIIGENAKDEVRKLLKEAEDEDSFEEEEVENDTASTDNDEVIDTDSEVSDDTDSETTDVEDGIEDTDSVDGGEDGDIEDTADDDLWNDLEKCKSADGEYDCTGMDDGNLLKVLKAMGPEDGIRVMSNGDGTVEVEVDGDMIDGQQEFIIDLDDFEGDGEFEGGEDADVELELNEDKDNTGYTNDYQHDTAMTVDSNKETANPKTTYSMDAGVPTGTEKPWAQDGDRQPYDKNVNEDVDECGTVFEIEEDGGQMIDETEGARPNWNNVRKKLAKDNQGDTQFPRMGSKNGELKKGSGEPVYSSVKESVDFKKKVNRLWEENKQMKSIIPQLNNKLMESMVINASMGYIVRLLNENSTSVDEKKQISERFAKVNTLEEGKKLYETISEELRGVNRRNDVNGIINSQLAEGKQAKQNLVETTMYKSEKVNETLDFMKRLNKIK